MANKRDFPHPFSEVAKKYRRFRRNLPDEISTMAVNTFKENFRRGGYEADTGGVNRWKKRKDTRKGKGRAILVKTGRMKRSIRKAPTYEEARVVTNVPYAQAHNEGFNGTVTVKAHKRRRYNTIKKGTGKKTKTGKERMKTVKQVSSTYKVRSHTRKVDLPARPFMKTTTPLLHRINRHIEKKLEILWKRP